MSAKYYQQEKIGTERFNYDLMQREILLEDGWKPTLGGAATGYCPPDNADRETGAALAYKRRRLAPAKAAALLEAQEVDPIEAMAIVLYRAVKPGVSESAWAELGPGNRSKFMAMARAAARHSVGKEAGLWRENHQLRCERDAWMRFYEREAETNARLLHESDTRQPGQHPYHGPTKPNAEGNPEPVPDPVHERFHGSIGDVLAGKVIPAARRQMQEALKNAPKDPQPFPVGSSKDDPRRIGWRVKT